MLPFIAPTCTTKFFVFKDYELLFFEDPNNPIKYIFPEDYHYDFYSQASNRDTKEINLAGQAAYVIANSQGVKNLERSYNPLEDTPEIFTEIAKVDPFDDKDLMKFINVYGIPLGAVLTNDPDTPIFHDEINIINLEMDIPLFASELAKYKEAFYLWNALEENNETILNNAKISFEKEAKHSLYEITFNEDTHIKDLAWEKLEDKESHPDFYTLLEDEIHKSLDSKISFNHSLWKSWQKTKDKSLQEIAKIYFIHLLNTNDAGTSSFEIQDNNIIPGIRFSDLLEVAYFQLSTAVINNKKFKRCLNCDALFEVVHEGRKFCPPLPGRKRSTCENTYNQRLKRQRRKEK